MSYDLHITRKADWVDPAGPSISEAEWRAAVERDPDLGALAYSAGDISVKNPTPGLIRTMVNAAQRLGARVQGDDGEVYREDATAFHAEPSAAPSPAPDVRTRIVAWWRRRRVARELRDTAPTFRVGQRVKDAWGALATVTEVDPNANRGLGSVKIRLDDGRERHVALVASGLAIVPDPARREP